MRSETIKELFNDLPPLPADLFDRCEKSIARRKVRRHAIRSGIAISAVVLALQIWVPIGGLPSTAQAALVADEINYLNTTLGSDPASDEEFTTICSNDDIYQ